MSKIILQGNSKLLQPIITQILATYQLIESKDIGTVYATVNDLESTTRKSKPKVILFFVEDTNFSDTALPDNIPKGRRRIEGVIRFRLMNESTQTFSQANATALGRKIKEVFGANGGFVWNKGKTLYSYGDWDNGYQFQLLCRTKSEAKRIITSVLSLQNHIPDWKNLFENQNDQEQITYPELPGTQTVMGETASIPRSRPNVDVRFRYAYVSLSGVKDPIILYDRTYRQVKPLVT